MILFLLNCTVQTHEYEDVLMQYKNWKLLVNILFIHLFKTNQKDPKATDTAMTAYNHSFENNIET